MQNLIELISCTVQRIESAFKFIEFRHFIILAEQRLTSKTGRNVSINEIRAQTGVLFILYISNVNKIRKLFLLFGESLL